MSAQCLRPECVPSSGVMLWAAAVYPVAGPTSSTRRALISGSDSQTHLEELLRSTRKKIGYDEEPRRWNCSSWIPSGFIQMSLWQCWTADIFHVIAFQGGDRITSYNLKPVSSYHVILLSTGRTFISFSYIGSSSLHAFQPQKERSSTVFIALLIFRQCCLSVLWLLDLPVNMKDGIISLLNVRLSQILFKLAFLDVNPLVRRR